MVWHIERICLVILKLVRDRDTSLLGRWCIMWDRCVLYSLVILVNQGVWRHWYSIQVSVGVHCTEQWPPAELSSAQELLAKGYGYMCPLDLRLPWWLVSNSLYFGAEPPRHCDLGRKVSGCSQVLTKSVRGSRWELTPPIVGVNGSLYINLARPWPRQFVW